MLPSFILKGGEVSQFIIGGADLMFPGINIPTEGLPSFLAGEPWAVKVPGNPSPIAVSFFLSFSHGYYCSCLILGSWLCLLFYLIHD